MTQLMFTYHKVQHAHSTVNVLPQKWKDRRKHSIISWQKIKFTERQKNTAYVTDPSSVLLTAIVHATYPGFSLWSYLAQSRTNAPKYQGIAARKKPIMNLQRKYRSFALCPKVARKLTLQNIYQFLSKKLSRSLLQVHLYYF